MRDSTGRCTEFISGAFPVRCLLAAMKEGLGGRLIDGRRVA